MDRNTQSSNFTFEYQEPSHPAATDAASLYAMYRFVEHRQNITDATLTAHLTYIISDLKMHFLKLSAVPPPHLFYIKHKMMMLLSWGGGQRAGSPTQSQRQSQSWIFQCQASASQRCYHLIKQKSPALNLEL